MAGDFQVLWCDWIATVDFIEGILWLEFSLKFCHSYTFYRVYSQTEQTMSISFCKMICARNKRGHRKVPKYAVTQFVNK